MIDLALENGKVITAEGVLEASIGITEGKVVAIARSEALPKARQTINVEGLWIMPGVIDSHVHLREPGFTHKEDFKRGTLAAAAGGVTTVICMPTTLPPMSTVEAFQGRVEIGQRKAVVDFALQAAVDPLALEELPGLKEKGATSFEIFLEGAPQGMSVDDNGVLLELLRAIKSVGGIAGVYSSDEAICNSATERLLREGRKDPLAFGESHPPIAEALGVSRALVLSREVGVHVHFRQISTKLAMDLIKEAKVRRQEVTVEITPHHLLLTEEDLKEQGAYAKMTPPLRSAEDVATLWQALLDGFVDTLATDHAPHLRAEKDLGRDDIWKAPGGVPGLETFLPLMLNEVAKDKLCLEKLVKLLCENPARIFGLYPKKGTIRVGSDADLVVVDLRRSRRIDGTRQYTKAKSTPFHGWTVVGEPVLTLVRGRVIMEEGKIMIDEPWGRLVKPR